MPVHWREQDWEHLREDMREELGVQRHLVAVGYFFCYLSILSDFIDPGFMSVRVFQQSL
jgi:hypothetical protein